MIIQFLTVHLVDVLMPFTEREKIESIWECNWIGMGFGMTVGYTDGYLQLRNGCADLDVCKETGPQRETWKCQTVFVTEEGE